MYTPPGLSSVIIASAMIALVFVLVVMAIIIKKNKKISQFLQRHQNHNYRPLSQMDPDLEMSNPYPALRVHEDENCKKWMIPHIAIDHGKHEKYLVGK
jgi:hypothetical protein